MAANALLDRGWGKAVQLQHTDVEIRQLVEVKLNVVQPASHALPATDVIDAKSNDINDLPEDTLCLPSAIRQASRSNSQGMLGALLGPVAGEGLAGEP
jgi:hypothetical protein